MRTTLRINDALFADVKRLAIDRGKTFTDVVEDALQVYLHHQSTPVQKEPFKLHTVGGNGVQPGVDLSNNAALADLMDEHDGLFRR